MIVTIKCSISNCSDVGQTFAFAAIQSISAHEHYEYYVIY